MHSMKKKTKCVIGIFPRFPANWVHDYECIFAFIFCNNKPGQIDIWSTILGLAFLFSKTKCFILHCEYRVWHTYVQQKKKYAVTMYYWGPPLKAVPSIVFAFWVQRSWLFSCIGLYLSLTDINQSNNRFISIFTKYNLW